MTSGNHAKRLIRAVQELSMARDLDAVAEVVRHAARELVGADGATFVLRDGEQCFYRDEDAICPLWKGQRFPLQACISGWAMLNRQATAIEDIYQDDRIPHAAYRPTFVKSLVMVSIRTLEPIGAIGTYWASQYRATRGQIEMLQALADATSVALENVQVYAELERRVEELTGLYNRRGFLLLAERELQVARRRRGRSLLLYVDLDYLKLANDRFGHAAGDGMLLDAAGLLRSLFRTTDVVARIGGDEFVVLASHYSTSEEVLTRLDKAQQSFQQRTGRPLSLSVGAAESSLQPDQSLEQLLTQADAAMYANKCSRRRLQAVG